MSLKPTTATINESSPRAADWQKVFGTNTVRIKGIIPVKRNVCGVERELYFIDLEALTDFQRLMLVNHISRKFNISRLEVERELPVHGCPILSEDVIISFDARQFL
jgi:hypothetical protein